MKNKKNKPMSELVQIKPTAEYLDSANMFATATKVNEQVLAICQTFSAQNLSSFNEIITAQTKVITEMATIQTQAFQTIARIANPFSEIPKIIQEASTATFAELSKPIFEIPSIYEPLTLFSKIDPFNVEILSVFPTTEKYDQLSISVQTTERVDNDSFALATINKFAIEISTVKDSIHNVYQAIEKLRQENRQKDTALQDKDQIIYELTQFIKANNSSLAKIEIINYCGHSTTLKINNKTSSMESSERYDQICRTLLKDEESMSKVWYMDELLELWGDYKDNYSPKKLIKISYQIYYSLRHLNQKILEDTQVPEFFKFTTKKVWLNPIYKP